MRCQNTPQARTTSCMVPHTQQKMGCRNPTQANTTPCRPPQPAKLVAGDSRRLSQCIVQLYICTCVSQVMWFHEPGRFCEKDEVLNALYCYKKSEYFPDYC